MERWKWVLAVSFLATIPDVLTTYYGLETGAFVEGNPHVAAMLSAGYGRWLAWKALGALATTVLWAGTARLLRPSLRVWSYAPVITWIGLHAAVSAYNTWLIVG